MKKKLICIMTVFGLLLVMSIPVFASGYVQPTNVKQYYMVYHSSDSDQAKLEMYTSDTPWSYSDWMNVIQLSSGSAPIYRYTSNDGGQTWSTDGSIDSNQVIDYMSPISYISTFKQMVVYSNFQYVYNGQPFFPYSPYRLTLAQAAAGAHPEQVLLGIAAVLGGCLILLILFLSFRRGWRFLLTGLRKA